MRAASASRTDEILCLSDGRFGFKVAHPSTGTRVSTTSYQAVKETQDQAEDAERLRLYYVAMTRAMDRLIVSGSVDRSSERDDRTPIGWVLERLGLGEELDRAEASGPVEVERGNAAVVLRIDRFDPASPEQVAPVAVPARSRRGGPARPLRRRGGGDPGSGAAPARARRDPGAAARARCAALVQRDLAVRPLRVPLLRRAHRRHAAGAVGATAWLPMGPEASIRPRSATPCTGCSSSSTSRARQRRVRSSSSCSSGAGTRPCRPRRSLASASSCARTPDRRSPPASPGFAASGPSGRSRSSSTRCSSTAASTSSGSRASARSCSTTRPMRSSAAIRRRSSRRSTSTQQIVYAIACLRAGATEVEVVYHFLEDPDAVVSRVFTAEDAAAARRRAQRLDRPHPGGRVPADAERVRLLGLPGAQRRLRRAAARRARRGSG